MNLGRVGTVRSQPGGSSVGDSMPSLVQTKHQVGLTEGPVGFVIMPRGPGFLRDDDSDRQVEGAARHGAALPSPDASQGLSAQGFSQRRSARGFTAEFTAPSPLQIDRHSAETPPTLSWGSATPTLSRSALPQVAAYREMSGSTSRDTSLHPRHQGIAPYGTLEAAASRPGMGFTRTPGEEINHISMGDEKARPSALQAYASIENGSRESNVLQATDTLPSAAQRVRSAAQEGVSPGGSSARQVLASSELFPGYYTIIIHTSHTHTHTHTYMSTRVECNDESRPGFVAKLSAL